MTEKRRFPRGQALLIAGALIRLLEPACQRIEIAGSIRREKEDVGDIELLCIPERPVWRTNGHQRRLAYDLLDTKVRELLYKGMLSHRGAYGPQNKFLTHIASGIPVDIFTATEANWGMALLVRSGPADFNIRVMRRFRELGMRGHAYAGVTDREGKEMLCPHEETVFRLLGWEFIAPKDRT